MEISEEELNLIRQWFSAVSDLVPDYLEDADRELGKRIEKYVFERQRAALAR